MQSAEDFEFDVETSEGTRRAVISKSALRILSHRSGASPSDVASAFHAELEAIVKRKLATGHYPASGQIRLHGTDL